MYITSYDFAFEVNPATRAFQVIYSETRCRPRR